MNRLMIAGTGSGCGKTTIVCALLQALVDRGIKTASFKCGPDYIDPMFHRKVIGTESYNLDSFFCDENTLRYLLHRGAGEISVIEGVMGFYDGLNGKGSSFEVSQVADTPVVIVINARGMSESLGAVIKGFLTYIQPNKIVGFIFNRLAESREGAAEKLCKELGTEYLGRFPADEEFALESRHLGLVTAAEVSGLREKLKRLADAAEKYIRIDRLIELANSPELVFSEPDIKRRHKVRIGLSADEAFCFFYPENGDMLERMGAEIVYFSPLRDERLPEDIDGLILCGGYPELYAQKLSENASMLESIRWDVNSGLPCIAECGGFMYLHNEFEGMDGIFCKGAGVINGRAFKTAKLKNFGYSVITANADNILCKKGESFPVHEFHYFDSDCCGDGFIARKPGKSGERKCVIANNSLWAGFPHLYFYSNPQIAENFLLTCERFKENG
ncbi:MAG: cobyrinate a,c-diamide synthase [Huintestinicola sp.]|uniref:cobyrinate a,c-diamide synthase n=1 Tax=Huintestinicola sp. TaxID=2981661 RepID=UPI003F03293C